jgi:hypothetical protein
MKNKTWRAEEEEKKKKCVLILLNDTPHPPTCTPHINSRYHLSLPDTPRPPPHTHPFSTPGITSLTHPRPTSESHTEFTHRDPRPPSPAPSTWWAANKPPPPPL